MTKKASKPAPKSKKTARSASRSVPKKTKTAPRKKPIKKPKRSRSIQQTIREAQQYESNCARRDRQRRIVANPARVAATKASITSKPGKKTSTAPKKTTVLTGKPTHSSRSAVPAPLVAPSLPIAPSIPKRRTATGASKLSTGSKANLKHDPTLPLPQFGVIDVCFCIDATGSMSSYLAESKKTVLDIINKIQTKVQTEGIELRFAVVTYRDHPPQDSTYVTKVQDFTDDRAIRNYIQSLDATGGGDFAEAVHDGLLVAARDLSWRNYPMVPSLRYIFHVADAPPHGKQFEEGGTNGCTCGISTDAVTHAINHQQIHYRLIKINSHPHLNKMQEIFKKSMVDFDSAEIKQANEMNIKVSDMIIREIMPL